MVGINLDNGVADLFQIAIGTAGLDAETLGSQIDVAPGNIASSGPSSRKSWSAISTAATRAAALPASGCPDCGEDRLLMFSCRTRGFCPSCHAKRPEEWGEWVRETLLLDVAHRQVVFTIPRRLRIFFKYNRRRLAEIFGREVLADLVRKELLSPEWAERLLSWRHTGFNVHSRVRARTKTEAERVGKYMIPCSAPSAGAR